MNIFSNEITKFCCINNLSALKNEMVIVTQPIDSSTNSKAYFRPIIEDEFYALSAIPLSSAMFIALLWCCFAAAFTAEQTE